MEIKNITYKTKGMQKDSSHSTFNPEFSWDNRNIRLTARDGNDLLSITNEKGNLELILVGGTDSVIGKCIGSCVIGDFLVLFTNIDMSDRIYKISKPVNGKSTIVSLFNNGSLGFNQSNPIQTLPFYENESIQKVYWVDGINQTRVINIVPENNTYTNTSFDFIQNLSLDENVGVEKLYNTGLFKSGVIQYGATYFNKNGTESNLFWISDINYISFDSRAGKVDEIVQNAFKITLSNLDTKFGYVRIYSIYRTSLDSTPEVKNIVDLKVNSIATATYVDNGATGSIISSDFLLYVGGEELIPQCMSQKNNTLFLGNIKLPDNIAIPTTLATNTNGDGSVIATNVPIHTSTFTWEPVEVDFEGVSGSIAIPKYPYIPFQSNIKHFKFDETYRFGVQGQFANGKWSNPIWLGYDSKVDQRYILKYGDDNRVKLSYITGRYEVDNILKAYLSDSITNGGLEFIKVRPVMVPLSYSDRTIIAQGIVNNTLGIMKNRFGANKSSLPFSYPDYLFRTNGKASYLSGRTYNGQYSHFDLLKLNNNLQRVSETPSIWIENMGNGDTWDYHDINDKGVPPIGDSHTTPFGGDFDRDFFFVDRNIVNFWSPDVINNSDQLNSYINSVQSVGLYGFAFQTSLNSKFEIDFGDKSNSDGSDPIVSGENNYYKSAIYLNSRYSKRLFPSLYGEPIDDDGKGWRHRSYHNIPIWSPENYINELPPRASGWHGDITNINFTKLNKSGYNYFGINKTINTDFVDYKYNINKPHLLSNDSTIFYESNNVDNIDNGGNILYSKYVEKIYPSGSYYNAVNMQSAVGNAIGLQYKDIHDWGTGVRVNNVNSGLSIKYNTNTHLLFSFGLNRGLYSCMPRLKNLGELITYEDIVNPTNVGWYRSGTDKFRIDIIDSDNLNITPNIASTSGQNTLPIFDLYSNVIDDQTLPEYVKYGGISSDALYNNTWIPCGDSVKISTDQLVLNYTIGDTYITRFDMLRVFPNDINQIPQHTEIVSFICESFTNSDGRSDVNRYNVDSSLMTTGNYGLFNNIYSQKNNYFNYNILDPLLFNTNNYTNSIVWSKTKVSGESIDTWTHLNMLSSIDVDGTYGPVSSINLFNNDLYAFQPKGIARLLFNERIQQQASDGVSVELTNGYKVPDYRYLTNQYGCENKWSIIEGKGGIYFIDYINKSLILIGDGVKDIGLSSGFKSWFNNNVISKNYTLSYDRNNNDLYIHNGIECLNYSESTQSFVSFFDYIDVNQMKNVWDDFISIDYNAGESRIWLQNKGDYNMFYGIQKPFSIEYLLNPDPLNDKTFNTFEYRLNNQSINWNGLEVVNRYQYAQLNDKQYSDNLKNKFNVNRVQLPRQTKLLDSSTGLISIDTRNSLNRIRSTWAKMKLLHSVTDSNINKKFNMQDMTITYTV